MAPHTAKSAPSHLTEFDILKASHKFLRNDADSDAGRPSAWNDQLAKKYYDSLYREFALCDLKHYKSGNFALRWRTETEVLDGTGETSCANTRCQSHLSSSSQPALTTLELPFAYDEDGQQKQALVKVVLCPRCVRKLMWKRRHDKREANDVLGNEFDVMQDISPQNVDELANQSSWKPGEEPVDDSADRLAERRRRRRSSRSRSPTTKRDRANTPESSAHLHRRRR
ncbi:folate-sensitive fragile site protein Fra10Ac1-domain-containing protein [Phlebopus sp. FC_14]|nr:folate-sensitive fragile site protein Fra10Ac1-domain-containing protein [Phlebopus sp. FC_14]